MKEGRGACAEAYSRQASQARFGVSIEIGKKYFAWFQSRQFIHKLDPCPLSFELGHPKLSCGDVKAGQPSEEIFLDNWSNGVGESDGCQEMRLPGREEFSIDQRTGCI